MNIMHTSVLFLAAAAIAGCARQLPSDTQAYVKGVEQSASYHQGFTQGCETADLNHDMQKQRRDEDRFQSDPDYRLGWTAGTDKCHDAVITPNTGTTAHW